MALKKKIDKATFDALSDGLKVEYKLAAGSTTDYVLDVDSDGDDNPAELRRALERERLEAKEAKKRADAAEAKLKEGDTNNARKAGDIDALEKSWKEKSETEVAAEKRRTAEAHAHLEKVLIHDKANEIAHRISTVPTAMARLLTDRMKVEHTESGPIVRVLSDDGKPSALSLADLEKEMVANPKLAGMIVGSKASGSGAGGSNNGGGASKKLSEMGDAERSEWFARDPTGFQAAVEADRQTRSRR